MIKKTFYFLLIMVLVVVSAFLLSISFIKFDVESEIKVPLNEEKNLDIKTTFFGKEVEENIKVIDEIKWDKVGKYKLEYSYKILGIFNKKKECVVSVVDMISPEIKLTGDDKVEVFLDSSFIDPGYIVTDNYDTNIEVLVNGNVDTSKKGNYYLTYSAIDSSNNKSEVVRKVTVIEKNPADVAINEFNINNYFSSDVIAAKTDDFGLDYINKMVFVGDSVPWYFGLDGYWNSSRVFASPCLGPSNIFSQKVYWKNTLTNNTIPELINATKPEYVLVSIGFCEIVSARNIEVFVKNYEIFLETIMAQNPNTTFILHSLSPVINETLRGPAVPTNKEVNEYNYYIAKIAQKYGLKYLDTSSVLKNNLGMAEATLTKSDGYHPNGQGMLKMIEYIRTHGVEKE